MWPDRRILDLLGLELPILQAPMAGANGSAMAIAVSEAGGLGALPCAMLEADRIRAEMGVIRQQTSKPVNLNFFCHEPQAPDPDAQAAWKAHLQPYYQALGLDPSADAPAVNRAPFDGAMCEIVEETAPEVVSFHFGLPEKSLLSRVRATGAKIIASATTAEEARFLEAAGVDAVIAQGVEAGGHRGMFLTRDIVTQAGTFALVPQVADAVAVPVIATGGIADGRGVAAAFALGASAVQVGTAYLFTPEALISDLHRAALKNARDDATALTNIFSGRPARGLINKVMAEIGPMTDKAPAFPTAGGALAPLRKAAEAQGRADFSPLWSGAAAALALEGAAGAAGAGALTTQLANDGLARLKRMAAG